MPRTRPDRTDKPERRSQEDRSRATRVALVDTGRRLFAERGYADVSAEELVSVAGVTRGALHHHYGNKHGLFAAVVEELEAENTAEITAALEGADDPVTGMMSALNLFLMICRRPETVRIALTDAPAVLGWQTWREIEARYGLGMIERTLRDAVDAGLVTPAPVPVLAQLMLSAVTEAGLIIAFAEDPDTARAEAQQSLALMISGILRLPE